MDENEKITIDGIEYVLNDLPDAAKEQLGNIQAVDRELHHLQSLIAITQTARSTYAQALKNALNGSDEKVAKV